MPASQDARGVYSIACSRDCYHSIMIRVKSLSNRNPVPLGKHLDNIIGYWGVIISVVIKY